jgi:hypothetical protein
MQDPRALANLNNLNSYRAWQREAHRRAGFGAFPLLAMVVPIACALLSGVRRNLEVAVVLAGVALYLVLGAGLLVVTLLRLNAWKRAHPWTPPSREGSGAWWAPR